MKIDSKKIRAERERRAWSQEHLATVSGLGLRTIQRIEKTGAASFESARALAAVFQVDVASLRVVRDEAGVAPTAAAAGSSAAAQVHVTRHPARFRFRAKPMIGTAAAALTAAGALFVATKGFADVVALDVGASMNDDQIVERSRVVTEANDNVAFQVIDDMVRMVIVPTIEPSGIMLSTEIYLRDGAGYVLASSPKLLTADGKQAEIQILTQDGTQFRFSITPHQNPPHLPPALRDV
jgi:transcriptional regulator with XRE-family HTH domain